jgi:hypothetical protein
MVNSSKEIGLISLHNFQRFAPTHPFLCVNCFPLCTSQSMVNKKSCHPYMFFGPLQLSCIYYIFWPRRGFKKITCLIAFAIYSINSFLLLCAHRAEPIGLYDVVGILPLLSWHKKLVSIYWILCFALHILPSSIHHPFNDIDHLAQH